MLMWDNAKILIHTDFAMGNVLIDGGKLSASHMAYSYSRAISQMGSGASGLALFAFGLHLGATKITAQCLKFDLLSVVLIKSLVHPLVAIFIAYPMESESHWFNSLVIAASAPTAFVVYLMYKQFSTEEELVKKVVTLISLIATISLVWITMVIG